MMVDLLLEVARGAALPLGAGVEIEAIAARS